MRRIRRDSKVFDFSVLLCFLLHRRKRPCGECISAAMRRWRALDAA